MHTSVRTEIRCVHIDRFLLGRHAELTGRVFICRHPAQLGQRRFVIAPHFFETVVGQREPAELPKNSLVSLVENGVKIQVMEHLSHVTPHIQHDTLSEGELRGSRCIAVCVRLPNFCYRG